MITLADLDLIYGKVKFNHIGFFIGKSENSGFSSPEPKAHMWVYSIKRFSSSIRRPSVVRGLSTFSNDIFAEAEKPILFILHI